MESPPLPSYYDNSLKFMLLLGLTGDIACGKSTVAKILEEFGAAVIDADKLVHDLYADRIFARQVADLFEKPVLAPDGTIDRAELGALVFADARALRRLEALVHPAVAALRDVRIGLLGEREPKPKVIVLEAVKLIESGQAAGCDLVWCVMASRTTQMNRLMAHRGMNLAAAQARLDQQPSFEKKKALLGDIPFAIIQNDGSLEELRQQVRREWMLLEEKWFSGQAAATPRSGENEAAEHAGDNN